jgi:hydroxymethylpyrimidine pyrophosphatase-like HAD family hydrolase
MKRMMISSFYNTLIDKEDAIPMSTMLEIDKLRKKGILFSVCTNRDKEDVLYYNHDYPFIDYIISFNGNYIYDVNNDKCIYSNPLKTSVIKEIEKLFNDSKMIYNKEDNMVYKIEIEVSKKKICTINKLSNIDVYSSIFKYNKEYFIEITSSDIANAVKYLSTKLKLSPTDIASVIGNLSEKELIDNIENTYVVSNSPKELKKLTSKKTKSNNSKGVENIIKKYN